MFLGGVGGREIAVKTMTEVTAASAKAFRAEIILTATMRHPNVVRFVGACWERELICLCLEYIPTNLEDMLLASKA